nr:MAG TPA: hypothetical protein [Caudoviricetes sp.]
MGRLESLIELKLIINCSLMMALVVVMEMIYFLKLLTL